MFTREEITPGLIPIVQMAVAAVVAQGARCASRDGCEYRWGDMKCLVGHMLSDDALDEGRLVGSVQCNPTGTCTAFEVDYGLALHGTDLRLLEALQQDHDKSKSDDFIREFTVLVRHDAPWALDTVKENLPTH